MAKKQGIRFDRNQLDFLKSGKFAKSIKGQTTNQYEYAITYVQNESTQRIVSGTKVMLPRNPIVQTVQDRKFKTALQKAMTDTFKKKVRNA